MTATGGYGGNQNTCYTAARARGADMGIMLHPDYQYTPKLVTAMASMIAYDQFDYVLASRILGKGALAAICPAISTSRIGLSRLPRTSCLAKRSPNNTGCRAWSRQVLERLPLMACSDDFVFDIQMIAQATYFGFCVG